MAIKFVPGDAVFYSNRAACYLAIGHPHKALVDARDAVARRPDWPKAHHRQGSAMYALGRYAEALQAFSAGLRLKPGDASLKEGVDKAAAQAQREQREAGAESLAPRGASKETKLSTQRKAAVVSSSDSDSERDSPLRPVVRRPWFDCATCDNKTRDEAFTRCCMRQLCGTCFKRAQGCPFKCGA